MLKKILTIFSVLCFAALAIVVWFLSGTHYGVWLLKSKEERVACYEMPDKNLEALVADEVEDKVKRGVWGKNSPDLSASIIKDIQEQSSVKGDGFYYKEITYVDKNSGNEILIATVFEDCEITYSQP